MMELKLRHIADQRLTRYILSPLNEGFFICTNRQRLQDESLLFIKGRKTKNVAPPVVPIAVALEK